MRRGYIFTAASFIILASLDIIYAFNFGQIAENQAATHKIQKEEIIIDAPRTATIKYGLEIDSLEVNQDKIKKNETWVGILTKYNVPQDQVEKIQTNAFLEELGNIKAGNSYTVYHTKEINPVAKCIVYEASSQDKIILRFQDSLSVFKEQKKIETLRQNITLVINSSLYEGLANAGATPDLAVKLAQIFADKVDFFHISKGDQLSIIYDKKIINGKPGEVGKIYSACFVHDQVKFYAFNFNQNGKEEYFDENGKSMSKGGFLKAPLKFFRISSKFSKKRFHPVQKIFKAHLGTDYAAPAGTPIHTVGDGLVVEAKYSAFNGNYVKVKHNGTYTTQYLHMSKIAKGIKAGKRISKGELIGYVGSTGLASGPHVCFRFWKNGQQIDGCKLKGTSEGEPIAKNNIQKFNVYKDGMTLSLQNIMEPNMSIIALKASKTKKEKAIL
jgi:murein DD-endopeptidase MepM/ murein hydrolase activator NlpD